MKERIDNETDYHKLNTTKKEILKEKDIENIQGTLSYINKNKFDKMIKPLKDEMEIYQKRKDAIESFQYFDKDNNGLINETEFKRILSLLKINEKIKDLLERASFEGNGFINYVEFVNFLFEPKKTQIKKIFKKKEEEEYKKEMDIIQDYTEEYEKMGIKKEDLEEEIKFHNEIFNEINEEENIDEINLTQEQIYKNNQKLNELSKKIMQGNLIINPEKKQNFLIKEMVAMGNIIKKKITIEKTNNPNNFIDPDEVLEDSNELFPLCLIAKDLEKNGIITAIEKESSNLNVSQACLQMLFNGMASKTKLNLKFDFGEKENNKLLYEKKYRDKFIEEIKEKISKELDISSKEILFISYRRGSFNPFFVLPMDYSEYKKSHKAKLTQLFKKQKGFVNMKEEPVTKAIFLTADLLEPAYNMNESDWPRNIQYRGPIGNRYRYYPPFDWKGYGLKVKGKYKNDNWLTFNNTPGEWWIAYHGLGNPKVAKNIFLDRFKTGTRHEFNPNQKGFIENDLNHPRTIY